MIRSIVENRNNNLGFENFIASKKLNRAVPFWSPLQKSAIQLFEEDPEVIFYQEKPTFLKYYDFHGRVRTYQPDFLIIINGEYRYHIEVMYLEKLSAEDEKEKFKCLRKLYNHQEEFLLILTQKELYFKPKKAILELLSNNWLYGL